MPGTYFLLKVLINKKEKTYGPYLTIADAAEILVEHPQVFLFDLTKRRYSYKAEIHEVFFSSNGWETVSIPITENECIMSRKSI
mgnify:CR=1 FL=1